MSYEAIQVITGSSSVGDFYHETMDSTLINIVQGIETMNDPAIIARLNGMDFLNTFIRDIQGVQGHIEGTMEYKAFFSDDGSYQDGVEYRPDYHKWTFYRKGYIIKDFDFSLKMFTEAYETGKDIRAIIATRMQKIGQTYLNQYLPRVAYETLFTVPEDGGRYTENFGFLKNVQVDPFMLKPFAQAPANLVRNHWRGIEGAQVGYNDLDFTINYLNEYMDVMDSSIIGVATRSTLSKLINTLASPWNIDVFERTGQPTTEIAGMRYIKNDFMPKDVILFLAGDASHLITRLISPREDMRGIALFKEQGFDQFNKITDIKNTFFKIMPVGYHLTGRHYGLFLSLTPNGGTGAANPDRLMGADEITRIASHRDVLRSTWYANLR